MSIPKMATLANATGMVSSWPLSTYIENETADISDGTMSQIKDRTTFIACSETEGENLETDSRGLTLTFGEPTQLDFPGNAHFVNPFVLPSIKFEGLGLVHELGQDS